MVRRQPRGLLLANQPHTTDPGGQVSTRICVSQKFTILSLVMKFSAIRSTMLPVLGGAVLVIAGVVAIDLDTPVPDEQVSVSEILDSDLGSDERFDFASVSRSASSVSGEKETNEGDSVIVHSDVNVSFGEDHKEYAPEENVQQPVVLAKNVFPEPQPWISRTGNLEGSVLCGAGSRVIVVASKLEPGAAGIGLELLVEEAVASDTRVDLDHSNEGVTEEEGLVATNQPSSQWNRLSHEEELFRAKWGWNAFNEVQKVLREESD